MIKKSVRCSMMVIWLLLWGMPLVAETLEETKSLGEKQIFGVIEPVMVMPGFLYLEAKLDTGADTSSIHAEGIELFSLTNEKGKKEKWVRFRIVDDKGKRHSLERKVEREVRIRKGGGVRLERYVVKLGLCLGSIYREVEVNLAERKRMSYRLLLGINFMKDYVLVDPSEKNTSQPEFPAKP